MLAYVAIQGANPSWRFVADQSSWTLVPIQHDAWLPTGVDAPFLRSNPWRAFIILASLWLLVCSVRVGFLRRQSFRILFVALIANAGLLALLGMAEQVTGTERIFWSYLPSNPAFAASFIYRNHAGAYFDLMVALATGLAWWHFRRTRRLLEGPGKTVVFAFFAAFIGIMVISSASRMAIFVMLLFAALVGCSFIAQFFRREGERNLLQDWGVVLTALGGCLAVGFIAIRADAVWGRFAELASDPGASMSERALVRHAAGQMLGDRWLFGWGAGCFRYFFPIYAQHYPPIYEYANGLRKYWEHAHDDLLEIPIELGVAGLLPLFAALGIGIVGLWRRRFWRNPVSYCLIAACLLTAVHAWLDFVFQCPAVLLTWAVLLVSASRWSEIDTLAARRRINQQTGSIRAQGGASPA
jgi:O-antigen ligase